MDPILMSIEFLRPWKSMLKPTPAFLLVLILLLLPQAAIPPAIVYMAETPDLAAAVPVFAPARTGGELLVAELRAAVVGCFVELLFSKIRQDKAPPTQICCAILLAAVLGGLWHRFWAPLRRRRAASTSQTPWLSLLSGGWVWVATFSIASPTTTWSTYCDRAVGPLLLGSSVWLPSLFSNSLTLCLNRLRRQPQGLQGDHHVPSLDMEMEGHGKVA